MSKDSLRARGASASKTASVETIPEPPPRRTAWDASEYAEWKLSQLRNHVDVECRELVANAAEKSVKLEGPARLLADEAKRMAEWLQDFHCSRIQARKSPATEAAFRLSLGWLEMTWARQAFDKILEEHERLRECIPNKSVSFIGLNGTSWIHLVRQSVFSHVSLIVITNRRPNRIPKRPKVSEYPLTLLYERSAPNGDKLLENGWFPADRLAEIDGKLCPPHDLSELEPRYAGHPAPRRDTTAVAKPAWAIRLHDLKREFLQAAKSSRLRFVLVQSANGQSVDDLQPTCDDPLRFGFAFREVMLSDQTPATRWTYQLGLFDDSAKRLVERGDNILKLHGDEILRLFGLPFIDSGENWAWMLWQLKSVEHPYRGDIEAKDTIPGFLSPDEFHQLFEWGQRRGPKPDWYVERCRSFRVDLPHVAAASIAAIRAILDRVGSVPKLANERSEKPNSQLRVERSVPEASTKTREDEPHPDGPEDPYWLWWNGKRYPLGSNRKRQAYELLKFFWSRESATFQELFGPGKPWTEAVQDHTFSNAASNFNNDMPRGFPWRLRTGGGCMFKEKISLKS